MAALHLTQQNFKQTIEGGGVVLVDFWAGWCSPCRMIAPIVEEVAAELEGRAKVGKVNVDEEEELSREFSIMSIPTLIVFKDGKLVDKMVGVPQNARQALVRLVEKHL